MRLVGADRGRRRGGHRPGCVRRRRRSPARGRAGTAPPSSPAVAAADRRPRLEQALASLYLPRVGETFRPGVQLFAAPVASCEASDPLRPSTPSRPWRWAACTASDGHGQRHHPRAAPPRVRRRVQSGRPQRGHPSGAGSAFPGRRPHYRVPGARRDAAVAAAFTISGVIGAAPTNSHGTRCFLVPPGHNGRAAPDAVAARPSLPCPPIADGRIFASAAAARKSDRRVRSAPSAGKRNRGRVDTTSGQPPLATSHPCRRHRNSPPSRQRRPGAGHRRGCRTTSVRVQADDRVGGGAARLALPSADPASVLVALSNFVLHDVTGNLVARLVLLAATTG